MARIRGIKPEFLASEQKGYWQITGSTQIGIIDRLIHRPKLGQCSAQFGSMVDPNWDDLYSETTSKNTTERNNVELALDHSLEFTYGSNLMGVTCILKI